jgi:predicted transcriptional regulator
MAEEARHPGAYQRLVTKIISSYVSHHNLGPEQIPELINLVHRTMDNLGKPVEAPSTLSPAVPIRRSVQKDAVVCLDCGWRGKMLRRHLSTRHGLSGDEYLRRWKLASDHPLTAPNYSEQRSALAKELGLGRGRSGRTSTRTVGATSPARRGRPRGRPRNADR